MKHYQTRIAFAEKEIKRLAQQLSKFDDIAYVNVDLYLEKIERAYRIRKYYIAKNYEYKRARMKNLHK